MKRFWDLGDRRPAPSLEAALSFTMAALRSTAAWKQANSAVSS